MYSIIYKKTSARELLNLPAEPAIRIRNAINNLATTPFPRDCKKLTGIEAYRIRIGNYRVIYSVESSKLIILIIKIAHRRDVYR